MGSAQLVAQNTIVIKGTVIDSVSRAPLPLTNIVLDDDHRGTISSESGRFRLTTTKGEHLIRASFVGYKTFGLRAKFLSDTTIVLEMIPTQAQLLEVEVVDTKNSPEKQILNSTQTGVVKIEPKVIERMPTVTGERDVIKVLQLLPGVNKGLEGSSDFFVRGGDADQNLLLLDGATIYNTGHLFGFVSVFNSDVIGDAVITKGAFTPDQGGRLSSILDISTKNSITDQTNVRGSIGAISSKLSVNAPIKKNKAGIMLSGRRTYIDRIIKSADIGFTLPYHFYDFNGRVDWQTNDSNSFFFSYYAGSDHLRLSEQNIDADQAFTTNFDIHNNTQTFGWKQVISNYQKLSLELFRSEFGYRFLNSYVDDLIEAESGITDLGARIRVTQETWSGNTVDYGALLVNHKVQPILFNTGGLVSHFIPSSRNPGSNVLEGAVFLGVNKMWSERVSTNIGARQSFALYFSEGYGKFEPRFSIRWKVGENDALKASYSRMAQYLHRVSSSALSLPMDLWYTITEEIKPQTSNQWTVAWVKSFPRSRWLLETEYYFKRMDNLTEYLEGTNLLFNADFQQSLVQGTGRSHGLELLMKKQSTKLHGWVSYSLTWTTRQFDELNLGERYPATYDRRHNVAIVTQYELSKRFAFSAVWEYLSGSRFTPVIGQYGMFNPLGTGIDAYQIFPSRNEVSLSSTHRLDVMVILKPNNKHRFKSELQVGVYNVYNRASPVSINVVEDGNGNYSYMQPGLFGAIPFISYHFSF